MSPPANVPASDPAQTSAEAVGERLAAGDAVLRLLGLRIVAIAPGVATVSMTVRADMLNGLGVCHGGLVATLADTAFAYACNAQGEPAVASGFEIDLLAPSHAGDELSARAAVVHQGARSGIYDIEVSNQRGERVALMRGRARRWRVPG